MNDSDEQVFIARPIRPDSKPPRPTHPFASIPGAAEEAPPAARPLEALTYAPSTVIPKPPAIFAELELSRRDAAIDLLIAIGLSLLGGIAIGVAWSMLDGMGLVKDLSPGADVFLSSFFMGMMTLAIVALVLVARRQPIATIGMGRPRLGITFAGALAALPCCYFALIATGVAYTMVEMVGGADPMEFIEERQKLIEMMPEVSLLSSTLFALFVGVHEEVLFRGFVLTRMCSLFRSKFAAILVSSALFGLMHMYQGMMGVFQTAAIGLVLALLVTLTRSLWAAILAHGLFDAVQLAMMPHLAKYLETISEHVTTAPAS